MTNQSLFKTALIWATIFGFLTVALGAFGAHGLKPLLVANDKLEVFKTAVLYQSIHALTLLALGILTNYLTTRLLKIAIYAMIIGVLLFSGSLYVLAITNVTYFGIVTPLGGVALLVSWGVLLVALLQYR